MDNNINNTVYEEPERAATENETDKKCPQCGGVMDFDPATGGLLCPYCGFKREVENVEEQKCASELDFNLAEDTENCDWGVEKREVICKSCGAETVYDVNDLSNECPYCGSNQVMTAEGRHTMAPGGVCPFKIDREKAGFNFMKWLKGKLFCPSAAKKSAKAESFKGVYLPYWTFDADTYSQYTARYGIDRTVHDKDGNSRTVTDWHRTAGEYSEFIDDQTVLASTQHDANILAKIEPFDTAGNVSYKPEYVAGFASERYSIGLKEAWERAVEMIKRRLKRGIEDKVESEHNADHVDSVQFTTNYNNVTYKYLLLPVWISSFKYKNKVYQFVVNGQTGKVGGKSPVSPLRVTIAILIGLAALLLLWYVINK